MGSYMGDYKLGIGYEVEGSVLEPHGFPISWAKARNEVNRSSEREASICRRI